MLSDSIGRETGVKGPESAVEAKTSALMAILGCRCNLAAIQIPALGFSGH
jgi:hypothetical protein